MNVKPLKGFIIFTARAFTRKSVNFQSLFHSIIKTFSIFIGDSNLQHLTELKGNFAVSYNEDIHSHHAKKVFSDEFNCHQNKHNWGCIKNLIHLIMEFD